MRKLAADSSGLGPFPQLPEALPFHFSLTEGKLGVCMATLAPEAPVMQVWATRSFPVVPFATAFQV